MKKKCGPDGGLGALGPNNAKKSTFFTRFLTFGAHFSGVWAGLGLKLGGNLDTTINEPTKKKNSPTQQKKGQPKAASHFTLKTTPKMGFLGPSAFCRAQTRGISVLGIHY